MSVKKTRLLSFIFHMILFFSIINAACTPSETSGDDAIIYIDDINGFQKFYGGSDTVTLNNVTNSDSTNPSAYWLDVYAYAIVLQPQYWILFYV